MATATTEWTRREAIRGDRCEHCGAPIRPVTSCRRFALRDAMVLIAATALAFALVRPVVNGPLRHGVAGMGGWERWVAVTLGLLVTWTPAVLSLRLRGPRPALRRLARQPGFAASVASATILGFGALTIALLAAIRAIRWGVLASQSRNNRLPLPDFSDPTWWAGPLFHIAWLVGPAVAGAWVLLALSGRRRAEAGWVDRLGRALGAAWIFAGVALCWCLLYSSYRS